MPLPDIQLDDRTFEDLFQEARRRIPAYTPEWTDHNESDPGITLLQLFAWLEEMILYRMNKVPRKNFSKFLELVGLTLEPPAPAHAELTFTLAKNAPAVLIPQGTQVSLADAGDGPPVIFETDDNLFASGIQLVSIQSFDGAVFSSFTSTGQSFAALSETPQAGAALYLGFDQAFPDGVHRITIHTADDQQISIIQGGTSTLNAPPPPVEALWEYWAGQGRGWEALTVTKDATQSLTKSGVLTFQAPADADKMKVGLLKKPDDPALYWLRYRIVNLLGAGYENPPRIQDVLLNTISATNAVTERMELLGAANGRPNQTLQLARFPVLPLTPGVAGFVEVDEGDGNGYQLWTQVEDFNASGREDKHYTLNLSTGLVSFGDGEHGKIPRWLSGNGTNRDDADVANVRAREYRWGGGARANAGGQKITSLLAAIPFVQSVTNLRPSVGGQDEESVDEAEARAPMTLRTATRAVTGEDFAFLAQQTPGAQIKRAQAFPLLNPNFRVKRTIDGQLTSEVPIPGAVTIVVIPESTLDKPIPSQGTLQLVANWLDDHRLLTAELFVTGPRYREVSIEAQIIAKPSAESGLVQQALQQKLHDYFHPLIGGFSGGGWDFGGKIYFSETFRQILETDGVLRIVPGTVKTFVDGVEQPPCTDIDLEPDEIIFSTGHNIQVSYE